MNKPPVGKSGSDSELDAFLDAVKRTPAPTVGAGDRGRLIFAMDATMSREATWDMACKVQGEMFDATRDVGGLDVQLLYFRGFGECRSSKWQPDAKGLARLMTSVACRGGQTQIGKVLSHIIRETDRKKVGAAVFVGDAFEEAIDDICHKAGELGLRGVPVFVFQEGRDPIAERAFREIARLTGGAWCPFEPGSAAKLKALLSAVAVYASGGLKALEAKGRSDPETKLLLEQMRSGPRGR